MGLIQITQIHLDIKYFTLHVFVVESHVSNIYATWMYVCVYVHVRVPTFCITILVKVSICLHFVKIN